MSPKEKTMVLDHPDGSPSPFKYGNTWEWSRHDGDEHCSYCGSIRIERAIELLKTKGVRYTGCDWRGYPHKFRLNLGSRNWKVYNNHLSECPPEVVKEYADLCAKLLGVHFRVVGEGDDRKVQYIAVTPGWQTWGVVDTEPTGIDADAPKIPAWWPERLAKANAPEAD